MPFLFCHIGWMSSYEGLTGKPDKIVGGGKWVQEHGFGGEVCNFLRCKDGNVYGHFETIKSEDVDRPVSIELLGAETDDESIGGVDAIWTATHPQEGGRRVVGWYRDARVFRERQKFQKLPSTQHRHDGLDNFRVQARFENTKLLRLEERTLVLGHGRGWIGQTNWWFAEQSQNPDINVFLKKVHGLLYGPSKPLRSATQKGKGGWGGSRDPERKAKVEREAIAFVMDHYSRYSVDSVEDDNLGWDLEVRAKGKLLFCLEVKGLFNAELKVGLTPREYLALSNHQQGEMPSYRLCVVTDALSETPRLTIFRYDTEKHGWIDECAKRSVSPDIKILEAAIVSLG